MGCLHFFLNEASFPLDAWKSVSRRSTSTSALSFSSIAVPTAIEALILLHFFKGVRCLVKKNTISAHMLLATGTMIRFAVQTAAVSFMTFSRAAEGGFGPQLMNLKFWFYHEFWEFTVLGSSDYGSTPLEQHTSL